ncbi:putative peptidase S1 and S6 [Streptomyces sp. Tu6071]|nr:putative peptidase S1 and S6 [Streptomyces sp. Tu6071]
MSHPRVEEPSADAGWGLTARGRRPTCPPTQPSHQPCLRTQRAHTRSTEDTVHAHSGGKPALAYGN